MYSKPEFSPANNHEVHNLIDRTTFGTLITKNKESLMISHLIFMIDRNKGTHGTLISHLSKSNEHAKLIIAGAESVAIFIGENGYISPSWYPGHPERDSAPTWNFSVAHCYGRPQALDSERTIAHLNEAVNRLEHGREKQWEMSELGEVGIQRRVANIIAFELPIDRFDAKFKQGQDERLPDTLAAIEHMKLSGGCPLATHMEEKNKSRKY